MSFDSPVDGITNSIGISSWPQINQQLSEGPTEGKRRRGHGHSAQVEDHSLWTEGERGRDEEGEEEPGVDSWAEKANKL